MSRSPRASRYRRQSSRPRSPQGSQRLRNRSPHRPRPRRPPTGGTINLGNGIELTPAGGWEVKKTGKNVAQLSDGKSVFLGQSLQISQSTNPGQLCDAWHRNIAEGTTNGKFQDPRTPTWHRQAQGSNLCCRGDRERWPGDDKLYLFSLVSVRQSDGVTVIGTAYFTPNADTDQLNKDFTSMVNSMLESRSPEASRLHFA